MPPQPIDLFRSLLVEQLQKDYPHLTRGFIEQHSDELARRSEGHNREVSQSNIDRVASSIADKLPEDLFPVSAEPAAASDSPASASTALVRSGAPAGHLEQLLHILGIHLEKVRSGEIVDLCILANYQDGNKSLVFPTPCDLFAYLGFMHHAIYVANNTGFDNPEHR